MSALTIFDLAAKITLDTSEYERGLDNAEKKTGGFGEKLKSVLATAGKVAAAGLAAAGTAVVALGKQAIEAYADYEQLVGGVETLFKESADLVQQYAANAYKTAGLSANEYMETVTSFSASLLQSLGGDTEQAAKVADMAISDMSDNANKMGTSMESIQAAYQGFAKQNYTMLDNLKLGYGGTKTEMERLLADATALSGVEYDIESLSDVYEAIHVIQTELDITGTTSKEASSTISGSISSMKSAWKNLVVGVADGNADFETLVGNFTESVGTAAKNILPRISIALQGIGRLVEELAPVITQAVPALVRDVLPTLLGSATTLLMTVFNTLVETLPVLFDVGLQAIMTLADALIVNLPTLIPAVIDVIMTIFDKLTDPDTLAMLLVAAAQIIVAIAKGLVDAIPKILEKVPVILKNLVSALKKAAPGLWEASKELIAQLWKGIKIEFGTVMGWGLKILNKIWSGFKENWAFVKTWGASLINRVVSGFSDAYSAVKDIGKNIVLGIWDGISGMASWLSDKVTGWAGDLVGGVADFLGIASPSKVFAEIGKYSAMGIGVGFDKEFDAVNKKIQEDMERLAQNDFNVSAGASWAYSSSFNSGHESSMNSATALNRVEATLNQILDRMGFDVVLDDGTLVGRIDKALGQAAMRKMRGNT